MKWAFVLLALLPCSWCATEANSTEVLLSSLSSCARTCVSDAIVASNCSSSNAVCLCAQSTALTEGALCVSKRCSIKQLLTTYNSTNTYCDVPTRNKAPLFINITIIFGVLAGLSVAARIGSKIVIPKSDFGLDDLFIVLTFSCGIPSTVMNIHGNVRYGGGRDIWTIQFDNLTKFFFYFWLLEVLYFGLVVLLKMSLLFFYLRIFPGPPQKLLWGTVIFNTIFGFIFVLLAAFQCTPVSYFWTRWDGEHEGTCLNMDGIAWANAAISIALDLWMLAIPLWCLRSLKLHWKKKVGVAAMFIVGTFVTVVSIVRLRFLVDLSKSTNPTYYQIETSVWSTIEINVGIICASLPALRILFVWLFPAGGSPCESTKYPNHRDSYARRSKVVNWSHAVMELPSRGGSPSRPTHGATEMKRTFNVQHSDEDEASLVDKIELGRRGGASGTSGDSTSAVSL
ncbi:hypothetical protein EDB81DRAFT_664425 [Dactylonectria macrodidyma]|uniref:CFEM domain-containing protein n=1 Tax=Dactylonectria macrodidyma TaxID=307937 RepID=A0A9P9DT87_9HYPO|nr:hypothetical protein EDB81DRAFT_664425 [Dactylonectria macrodidyma]